MGKIVLSVIASILILGLLGLSQDSHADEVVITPTDTGTIRFFPELGILGEAPVGDAIQSRYFKTTEQNREFRRGFIEFTIPVFEGQIQQATLILTENRGTTNFPLPPDLHELSFYQADLVVDTSDYNRPTTLLTSFETDVNEPPQIFSFDVTSLINQFQGDNLGLRIKLAVDPTLNAFAVKGSSFGELNNNPPRIELTVAPPPQPIGGTLVPIDTTALLLASVQSISMWMIPVVAAGIAIGVFVIKRRK